MTEYPLIEIELYSNKKKYDFRPFLVKEEKLLVMASESGDVLDIIKATQQVITNCSFGKVKGDEIPIFDMQNVFIELRKKSIGEDIDARFSCGKCKKKVNVVIDLNRFKLVTDDKHDTTVRVNEDMTVEMRYPKATELKEIAGKELNADIFQVAAKCIEKIYYKEEVYEASESSQEERMEFIENMASEDFEKIKEFFNTMPVLENEINFTCKECGQENYAYMNGYLDFFA